MENLRYNNIVIATDADVDGMHILLLITFFLQFFPELIKMDICIFYKHHFQSTKQERNYLLLFWWRTKSSNRKLKPKPEITRFKGLGEISPDEFKILLEKLFGLTQLWWIKTHRSNNCCLSTWGKYARPTRIYHQEFEGGVGRDWCSQYKVEKRWSYL
jgi:hypothetical protein